MAKKAKSIRVNKMADEAGTGISVERIAVYDLHMLANANLTDFEEAAQSHRHDRHSFFLLESGTVHLEIDFQQYTIESPSVIYIHPDQVHRTTALQNAIVSSWAISNENLNRDYLGLLEDITPTTPLVLQPETFSIISETVSLCLKFAERRNDKLYHSLLKDSCNILVALVISQYMEATTLTGVPTRFEMVTKAFREMLEQHYTTAKRPAAYAQQLNISTPYLNECVKSTTGYSVSYHIQQRIVLEAKRLLYYSGKSIKEIATALGYDDYPYFARFFTKMAGMTAVAFRNKNHD